MRKPLPLEERENEHLKEIMDLGLEIKGLKDLTKQNLSKAVKRIDRND